MAEYLSIAVLFSVILAGAVTVFLPCTYPMIIGYLSLLIGDERSGDTRRAATTTLWFFAGFSATYALFGSVAGLLGQFSMATLLFNESRSALLLIGAVFLIIVGLVLLRAVPLPARLRGIRSVPLPKKISVHTWWGTAAVGVTFAVGWSPCIGPVLGGILILAGTSGSVPVGALLLLLFSAGMLVPMLALAALYSRVARYVNGAARYMHAARIIGGVLFISLGISFIVGDYSWLAVVRPPEFLEAYI